MKKWMANFILTHFPHRNDGRFKKGDVVKYNWMAKSIIGSAIKNKLKPMTVERHLYSDKSNVEFTNLDSCASFWVRKLYFWEK